jgi:hypothetical protein
VQSQVEDCFEFFVCEDPLILPVHRSQFVGHCVSLFSNATNG